MDRRDRDEEICPRARLEAVHGRLPCEVGAPRRGGPGALTHGDVRRRRGGPGRAGGAGGDSYEGKAASPERQKAEKNDSASALPRALLHPSVHVPAHQRDRVTVENGECMSP